MKPTLLFLAVVLLFGVLNTIAAEKGADVTKVPCPQMKKTTGCPGAPADLALSVIPSGFMLTWTLSPQDPGIVTGYEISRAVVFSGPYEVVGTVGKGVKEFKDTTAKPENIFYYKVRAVAGDSYSPFSKEVAGELATLPGK